MHKRSLSILLSFAFLVQACDNYDPVDCLAPYSDTLDTPEYQGTGCFEDLDRKECEGAGGEVSENVVDESGAFCEAQGYPVSCGDGAVYVATEEDCGA